MTTFHEVLNPKVCQCNPSIRRDVIQGLPFLQNASKETLDQFAQCLQSDGMPEGREISPLKYKDGLFGVVARGAFKVYRYVSDDQFVVFDVLTAGDFFLYGFPEEQGMKMFLYPDQIAAMTTCCLLYMNKTKLDPILQRDPHLIPSFLGNLTGKLVQLNERFVRFMAFPAEHRLAFLLTFLHSKAPKNPDYPRLIPFNLTRKDLASMSGLTLETASRILTAFEKDGLIRSGRGWIEILNFQGLAARSPTESL